MHKKRIWIIPLLCSIGLLLVGITTELYLGDEIVHYRFAKDIFSAGKRVTFDSLYGKEFSRQMHYMFPPLWHLLLAFLWKIVGGISFIVAQIYHILYYSLLLISTAWKKNLWGRRRPVFDDNSRDDPDDYQFWNIVLRGCAPGGIDHIDLPPNFEKKIYPCRIWIWAHVLYQIERFGLWNPLLLDHTLSEL